MRQADSQQFQRYKQETNDNISESPISVKDVYQNSKFSREFHEDRNFPLRNSEIFFRKQNKRNDLNYRSLELIPQSRDKVLPQDLRKSSLEFNSAEKFRNSTNLSNQSPRISSKLIQIQRDLSSFNQAFSRKKRISKHVLKANKQSDNILFVSNPRLLVGGSGRQLVDIYRNQQHEKVKKSGYNKMIKNGFEVGQKTSTNHKKNIDNSQALTSQNTRQRRKSNKPISPTHKSVKDESQSFSSIQQSKIQVKKTASRQILKKLQNSVKQNILKGEKSSTASNQQPSTFTTSSTFADNQLQTCHQNQKSKGFQSSHQINLKNQQASVSCGINGKQYATKMQEVIDSYSVLYGTGGAQNTSKDIKLNSKNASHEYQQIPHTSASHTFQQTSFPSQEQEDTTPQPQIRSSILINQKSQQATNNQINLDHNTSSAVINTKLKGATIVDNQQNLNQKKSRRENHENTASKTSTTKVQKIVSTAQETNQTTATDNNSSSMNIGEINQDTVGLIPTRKTAHNGGNSYRKASVYLEQIGGFKSPKNSPLRRVVNQRPTKLIIESSNANPNHSNQHPFKRNSCQQIQIQKSVGGGGVHNSNSKANVHSKSGQNGPDNNHSATKQNLHFNGHQVFQSQPNAGHSRTLSQADSNAVAAEMSGILVAGSQRRMTTEAGQKQMMYVQSNNKGSTINPHIEQTLQEINMLRHRKVGSTNFNRIESQPTKSNNVESNTPTLLQLQRFPNVYDVNGVASDSNKLNGSQQNWRMLDRIRMEEVVTSCSKYNAASSAQAVNSNENGLKLVPTTSASTQFGGEFFNNNQLNMEQIRIQENQFVRNGGTTFAGNKNDTMQQKQNQPVMKLTFAHSEQMAATAEKSKEKSMHYNRTQTTNNKSNKVGAAGGGIVNISGQYSGHSMESRVIHGGVRELKKTKFGHKNSKKWLGSSEKLGSKSQQKQDFLANLTASQESLKLGFFVTLRTIFQELLDKAKNDQLQGVIDANQITQKFRQHCNNANFTVTQYAQVQQFVEKVSECLQSRNISSTRKNNFENLQTALDQAVKELVNDAETSSNLNSQQIQRTGTSHTVCVQEQTGQNRNDQISVQEDDNAFCNADMMAQGGQDLMKMRNKNLNLAENYHSQPVSQLKFQSPLPSPRYQKKQPPQTQFQQYNTVQGKNTKLIGKQKQQTTIHGNVQSDVGASASASQKVDFNSNQKGVGLGSKRRLKTDSVSLQRPYNKNTQQYATYQNYKNDGSSHFTNKHDQIQGNNLKREKFCSNATATVSLILDQSATSAQSGAIFSSTTSKSTCVNTGIQNGRQSQGAGQGQGQGQGEGKDQGKDQGNNQNSLMNNTTCGSGLEMEREGARVAMRSSKGMMKDGNGETMFSDASSSHHHHQPNHNCNQPQQIMAQSGQSGGSSQGEGRNIQRYTGGGSVERLTGLGGASKISTLLSDQINNLSQMHMQNAKQNSATNSTSTLQGRLLLITQAKMPAGSLIQINVKEERLHMHHQVNKAIKLCNSFAIEAFLKQSTNYFTSLHCGNGKEIQSASNIPPSKAAAIFKQQQNNANQIGLVDLATVQSLARQLSITLPKNNDLRGKAFLSHSKEKMYLKLFTTLNQSNGVNLKFERKNFKHYKGFIGRGNNAQLLFTIFKQTRWWWTLSSNQISDNEGKMIPIPGVTLSKYSSETFKEHNFIFTQWKKMVHFNVMSVLKTGQGQIPGVDLPLQNQPQTIVQIPQTTYKKGDKRGEKESTDLQNTNQTAVDQSVNISNEWRIYAKLEANYHLSNKYALFLNMKRYYQSIGRDPFDVLPLSFHVKTGTNDKVFHKFKDAFSAIEEKNKLIEEEESAENEAQQLPLSPLAHHHHSSHNQKLGSSPLKLSQKQPSADIRKVTKSTPSKTQLNFMTRHDPRAKIRPTELDPSKFKLQSSQISGKQLQIDQSSGDFVPMTPLTLKNGKSSQNNCLPSTKNDSSNCQSSSNFVQKTRRSSQYDESTNNCGPNQQLNTLSSMTNNPTDGTQDLPNKINVVLSSTKLPQINKQQQGVPSSYGSRSTAVPADILLKSQQTTVTVAAESSSKRKAQSRFRNQQQSAIKSPRVDTLSRRQLSLNQRQPQQSGKIQGQKGDDSQQKSKQKDGTNQPTTSTSRKSQNIWIVKPGENTNRGNGITVCSKMKEIRDILVQSEFDRRKTFIVQKYIERPALYNQRKFDIRCFGMLTVVNNRLKGFVFDDGYLRTSSRPFKNSQLTNKLIHLTNDAVQKRSDEYGRFETGNKLSFGDYQQYLNDKHGELKIDFRKHIFSQIKQIMTDTFRATHKIVAPTRDSNHHSFEILGYDFMLDEDFKVYLIEVNTNPCIETSSPLLEKQIPNLLDSGLRIAMDPLFPPPSLQKRMNQQISLIQWQLTFDETSDAELIEELQREETAKMKAKMEEHQDGGVEEEKLDVEDLIAECEDEEAEFD